MTENSPARGTAPFAYTSTVSVLKEYWDEQSDDVIESCRKDLVLKLLEQGYTFQGRLTYSVTHDPHHNTVRLSIEARHVEPFQEVWTDGSNTT